MALTGSFVRRDKPFGERGDAQDGSTPYRGPRGAHGLLRAPRRLPVGAAMPFGGFNALHDAAEEPSAGMINPFLLGAAHSATPDYWLEQPRRAVTNWARPVAPGARTFPLIGPGARGAYPHEEPRLITICGLHSHRYTLVSVPPFYPYPDNSP